MSNLDNVSKEEMQKYKKSMNINHTYPSPEDLDFQYQIYQKREFYGNKIPYRDILTKYADIKEYRDNICARDFKLHEHQSFLSNFINPDTPYKGLLIFHGTGTGKTCAAITISEKFKPIVEKYNTKIYVLVSGPLIKENWRSELLKCTGETYIKYEDKSMFMDKHDQQKIKKNAVNLALQYYRFMSYRTFYKKVLGEKILEKTTKGNKIKVSYRKTEEGEYERDIAVDRIYNLNNTIIVVDEAHNLTGNDYGEALKKIIKNSTNLRILLLSATPMKNLADDIIELLNFIRPQNDPILREKIFTSNKNYLMDFKENGLDYLKKMSRGYVSYLRGADPLTFAERVDKGEIPSSLIFTRVIRCKMLKFQHATYMEAIKDKDDTLDKKSEAVANFVFPGLSQDRKSIQGYYGREGISILRNQLKTHYDLINKKIGTEVMDKKAEESDFVYLAENGKIITGKMLKLEYLKYFSIKFYVVLKKLQKLVQDKKGPGTAFIYSNLVKVGIDLFQEILIQNGYLEYQENYSNYTIRPTTVCYFCGNTYNVHQTTDKHKDHKFYPATFIPVTGKSEENTDLIPEDKQKILINVFNNIENKEGKLIKFVLGSKVMNEGITLENVREVHILDVHFNLGKVDQVIGRAIRHCKHYHITNDANRYPKVNIYKYVVSVDDGLTTEEELYKKAELKYLLIKKVERGIKENSIDCPLFRHGNIFPEELKKYKDCGTKDNPCPAVCDYMQCNFKCDDPKLNKTYFDQDHDKYIKINKDRLDYSTFTNELARNEIDYAKNKIKEMYKTKYNYTLKQIISYVFNSYNEEKQELFNNFFVYKALDELIPITENDFNNFKDTILDKFNKPGYLIQRNKYYIFQPFDQNEDVPMYYRSTFDKHLLHKLTLYKYMKNTDVYKLYKGKKKKKYITKSHLLKEVKVYDFESVQDYYDNRNEFDVVGIIDKELSRRKTNRPEEIKDVFKIRNKRSKILEKKRGTGIPSLKGAVCVTSKSKEYLVSIAKKVGAKIPEKNETRTNVCNLIKERLLHLEKYSTEKDNNKFTYIMIPKNHPIYPFPYNLEDRVKYIKQQITSHIKFKIDLKVEKNLDKKTKLPWYNVKLQDSSKLKEFHKIFDDLKGVLEKGTWLFIIN